MSSKRLFADLIKRCDSVYSEAGGRDENAEKLKRARKDKVMALRLDLQTAVQETRKMIQSRDQAMFRGNGDSSDCAELRQQIRLKISNMHQQHSLLKEEVSKRNNSRSTPGTQKKANAELVELVAAHIAELEGKDSSRGLGSNPLAPRGGGGGGGGGGFGGAGGGMESKGGGQSSTELEMQALSAGGGSSGLSIKDALKSDLPDIATREMLQQMVNNDEQIDQNLDAISRGLEEVMEMGKEMNTQLDIQDVMLNDLENTIDKGTGELRSINSRLKKSLADIRGGDRVCMDMICLVLMLAIGGYLYNMMKGK